MHGTGVGRWTWDKLATKVGPDAEVPGWYISLPAVKKAMEAMARSTNDRIQYGGLPVWHHTLHGTAHDFIAKGTNQIGYVWYADGVGGTGYADMGRTGTSALAHYLYPTGDEAFRAFAKLNAECIGNHPDTFIDTHGCPLLGMVWTALGAATDPPSFRNGMRADREADPQRRPAGAHHQARSSMSVPPFQVATNH